MPKADTDIAYEMSYKGFTDTDIAKALLIPRTSLYRKANSDILNSIHKGRQELKAKVSEAFLDSLADTPANQQLLVKRLSLFNPSINISRPFDATTALKALSMAIKQYANGEINESQLRTIEATLNSYIKGYEVTEIEARLQVLEDVAQK